MALLNPVTGSSDTGEPFRTSGEVHKDDFLLYSAHALSLLSVSLSGNPVTGQFALLQFFLKQTALGSINFSPFVCKPQEPGVFPVSRRKLSLGCKGMGVFLVLRVSGRCLPAPPMPDGNRNQVGPSPPKQITRVERMLLQL